MGLNEVSNVLWRERQLLDILVFKLEEEQLVLAAGRTRWLAHATREVESVLGEIKRVELERALVVDEVAAELGLEQPLALSDLVENVPTPWDRIFEDHRAALIQIAQEIELIARGNRDLLARGQQAAQAALESITGDVTAPGDAVVDAYGARPAPRPSVDARVRLIDEVI
jgi:hypothetical protein